MEIQYIERFWDNKSRVEMLRRVELVLKERVLGQTVEKVKIWDKNVEMCLNSVYRNEDCS